MAATIHVRAPVRHTDLRAIARRVGFRLFVSSLAQRVSTRKLVAQFLPLPEFNLEVFCIQQHCLSTAIYDLKPSIAADN
jgi:hypothetical protein